MNVWQGEFPASNTNADGFYSTCPVTPTTRTDTASTT
jgi:hypothetical protein